MVVSRLVRVAAGIRCTQVGYPRANREEGILHAVSSDRVAGLAGLAVAEAKDEEVGEAEVGIGGVIEGCGDPKGVAEVAPVREDALLGGSSFASVCGAGDVQCSAEITAESSAGGGWSSVQGSRCGYVWLK